MVTVGVVLLVTFIPSVFSALTWTKISDNEGPEKREGAALIFDEWNDVLVLFSGRTATKRYPTDTWLYDISNDTWRIVAYGNNSSTPPGRRYSYFGLVRINETSLFVVSHGFGRVEYKDTWTFNMDTFTWTELNIAGDGPGERYGGHFGAVYGTTNTMWIGGGFTKVTILPSRYIDTYKLIFTSLSEAHWELVHPQPTSGNQFNPLVPHGRCLQGSAVVGEEMLVLWGGCMRGGNGGGPCPAEDGWVFDNTKNKWTELPRCATPRVWSAMAPLSNASGKAVLYGGSDIYTKQIISDVAWPENEVLVIDALNKQWTRYLVEAAITGQYPGRRYAHNMVAGSNGVVYMFGGKLLINNSHLNDLWILSGNPDETISTSCDRVWFSYAHLHGLFMIIAFGILFPTGAFIARYYRCKGSKIWFIVHVIIQLTAVLFSIPAFIMIFPTGASVLPTHPHAIIGIVLMTIMIIQPINGILRPHIKKNKEKSTYRKCWEWFHRLWGFFTIVLGLTQVTLGVFLIVPPLGVWVVWILMLGSWVIAFIIHEIVKCTCACVKKEDVGEEFELKTKHL